MTQPGPRSTNKRTEIIISYQPNKWHVLVMLCIWDENIISLKFTRCLVDKANKACALACTLDHHHHGLSQGDGQTHAPRDEASSCGDFLDRSHFRKKSWLQRSHKHSQLANMFSPWSSKRRVSIRAGALQKITHDLDESLKCWIFDENVRKWKWIFLNLILFITKEFHDTHWQWK